MTRYFQDSFPVMPRFSAYSREDSSTERMLLQLLRAWLCNQHYQSTSDFYALSQMVPVWLFQSHIKSGKLTVKPLTTV